MKILVVSSTKGNIDPINQYASDESVDVVLCTGDFGIAYRNNKYSSNFYEYLEGRKSFTHRVICNYGLHDNISLTKKLINKEVIIDNFEVIPNGGVIDIPIKEDNILKKDYIRVGAISGAYSPVSYQKSFLEGKELRHFTKNHINNVISHKPNILLMYEFMGGCSKKEIVYTKETFDFLCRVKSFYLFMGKYNWWGSVKFDSTNIVNVPDIRKGYFVIDTENEWNGKGINLDVKGLR